MDRHFHKRRRRQALCCTLCGGEIDDGEEYWFCNGSTVCGRCLAAFARQEFDFCRYTRGKEACP